MSSAPPVPPHRRPVATRPRRGLGWRMLGWALLIGSVGLVSCQSLFVL